MLLFLIITHEIITKFFPKFKRTGLHHSDSASDYLCRSSHPGALIKQKYPIGTEEKKA